MGLRKSDPYFQKEWRWLEAPVGERSPQRAAVLPHSAPNGSKDEIKNCDNRGKVVLGRDRSGPRRPLAPEGSRAGGAPCGPTLATRTKTSRGWGTRSRAFPPIRRRTSNGWGTEIRAELRLLPRPSGAWTGHPMRDVVCFPALPGPQRRGTRGHPGFLLSHPCRDETAARMGQPRGRGPQLAYLTEQP
jgi:hypothetical protein